MRILLVASKYLPEYTGASFRIDSMYRRLYVLDNMIEVEVLCGGIEHRERDSYVQDGFCVNRIKSRVNTQKGIVYNFISSYSEAFEAWRALRNSQADMIHVVGTSNLTATAIYYARLKQIPLLIELVTTGASPVQSLPGLHYLWKPSLQKQTAIIAISKHLEERCKSLNLIENIWYRPNPVDLNRFSPEPQAKTFLREKHTPFNDSDIVLLMVAKFMPQKNQIFLIDVLAVLPDRFKLVLAGPLVKSGPLSIRDREYYKNIQDKIKYLDLTDRVIIVCNFVDTAEYLKMSDIYLMPNKQEGLGTPLLESLACGIPVIANSNEPAFQDLLRGSSLGLLVDMVVQQWVQKIIKISDSNNIITDLKTKHLRGEVSSKIIDQHYWNLLTVLNNAQVAQSINIKQVLKLSE